MKYSLLAVCAVASLSTGAVVADNQLDESQPIELSAVQMDKITAAGLLLPNGKEVFENFDNPAPAQIPGVVNIHPGLWQTLVLNPNTEAEAAWEAHFNSPVIDCVGC